MNNFGGHFQTDTKLGRSTIPVRVEYSGDYQVDEFVCDELSVTLGYVLFTANGIPQRDIKQDIEYRELELWDILDVKAQQAIERQVDEHAARMLINVGR